MMHGVVCEVLNTDFFPSWQWTDIFQTDHKMSVITEFAVKIFFFFFTNISVLYKIYQHEQNQTIGCLKKALVMLMQNI